MTSAIRAVDELNEAREDFKARKEADREAFNGDFKCFKMNWSQPGPGAYCGLPQGHDGPCSYTVPR